MQADSFDFLGPGDDQGHVLLRGGNGHQCVSLMKEQGLPFSMKTQYARRCIA